MSPAARESRYELQKKPEGDTSQRGNRTCLSCGQPFLSPHYGVRRCNDCKESAEFKLYDAQYEGASI